MTVFRDGQMVELIRPVGGIGAGTVGTVVGVYGNGGCEVEVMDDAGPTLDVLTVAGGDIRPVE